MNLRATLLMAGLLAPAVSVWANRQPGTNPDSDYLAMGQQMFNTTKGTPLVVNAVNPLGALVGGSGVLLDQFHVVTAAHVKSGLGYTNKILEVALGTNALANDCQIAAVLNVAVHPTWDNSHAGASMDCALLTLDKPIYGTNLLIAAPPALFTICSSAGFGNVNDVLGEHPYDGKLRGWTTKYNANGSLLGDFSANYLRFGYSSANNGPLPGGGWYGDSGGPACDSSGAVIGLNVSWTTTANYALRLDVVQPWIASVIAAEPPHIYGIVTTNNDVRLDWWAPGGTNYVVQAASGLGGTNVFTDLSGVIALPGAGTVVTNYLDAGALTNTPARFYRIRTQ